VWKVSIKSPRGPQKYIKSYETIYIYHIRVSLSYLYGIIYQHNECVRVLLHGTITTFIKSAIPLSNLYDASWKVLVALKNANEKCNLEHIEFQISLRTTPLHVFCYMWCCKCQQYCWTTSMHRLTFYAHKKIIYIGHHYILHIAHFHLYY